VTSLDSAQSTGARAAASGAGQVSSPSRCLTAIREAFIREELLRHRQCLHAQSEHFSPRAVAQVDQAICHTLEHLGELCGHCDCERIVSCLLRQLDQVTNLSAWSDPKTHH
jgi:hypothetical protein